MKTVQVALLIKRATRNYARRCAKHGHIYEEPSGTYIVVGLTEDGECSKLLIPHNANGGVLAVYHWDGRRLRRYKALSSEDQIGLEADLQTLLKSGPIG